MDYIQQSIDLITQTKNQFLHTVSFIPNDKLSWNPSITAKSPMQILAHVAVSANFFAEICAGNSPKGSVEDLMKNMESGEREITTLESAISMINKETDKAIASIKKMQPSDLAKVVETPFMSAPLGFFVGLVSRHFDMHGAQIDYLQTMWGDLEFHMSQS